MNIWWMCSGDHVGRLDVKRLEFASKEELNAFTLKIAKNHSKLHTQCRSGKISIARQRQSLLNVGSLSFEVRYGSPVEAK